MLQQLSFILGGIFAVIMSFHWRSSTALQPYFLFVAVMAVSLYSAAYFYRKKAVHSYGSRALPLHNYVLCTALFFAAFSWFNVSAEHLREIWLSFDHQKHDIEVVVKVDSIIKQQKNIQSYRVKIVELLESDAVFDSLVGESIKLSDYKAGDHVNVEPCDKIRVRLRLKPIRGTANQFSFDYEQFAFSQGLSAQAYIRQWHGIEKASGVDKWLCANRYRQSFTLWLQRSFPGEQGAWLQALAIGDKSSFTAEQKTFLSESQLAHLFVISGLHVGIAAAWFYALGLIIIKRQRRVRINPLLAAAWLSILGSAAYVAMTGASLSGMRAFIMVVAIFSGRIVGFHWSIPFRLSLAFIVSFLLWPLSLLNAGFWLSYLAVLSIYSYSQLMSKRLIQSCALLNDKEQKTVKLWDKFCFYCQHYIGLQLFIFVCLLPITYSFNQALNLASPLINLLAIPVVSFIFVPSSLLILALYPVAALFNTGFLFDLYFSLVNAVSTSLLWFIQLLEALNDFFSAWQISLGEQGINGSSMTLLFFLIIASIVFFWRMRWFSALVASSVVFFAALGFEVLSSYHTGSNDQQKHQQSLNIQLFDVGQGLSVLLEVSGRTLLYDTGKAWPNGSMIQSVISPHFRAKSITHLDRLVLSHLDNDHAGGLEALLNLYAVDIISSSDTAGLHSRLSLFNDENYVETCYAGQSWQWSGVKFQVLHPERYSGSLDETHSRFKTSKQRNDQSCVLLVTNQSQALLLLGDISSKIELQLLKRKVLAQLKEEQYLTVVLAHHGSKYSSHAKFIKALNPDLTIASAAYLNRFKHPHPDVLKRLNTLQIPLISTAQTGQITMKWHANTAPSIIKQRSIWQDRVWNIAYVP